MKATNRQKPTIGSKRNGKTHNSARTVSKNVQAASQLATINVLGSFKCVMCNEPMIFGIDASIEHYFPISYFDANNLLRDHTAKNILWQHKTCNSQKGNKLPTDVYTKAQLKVIDKIFVESQKLLVEFYADKRNSRLHRQADKMARVNREFCLNYLGGYFRKYFPAK